MTSEEYQQKIKPINDEISRLEFELSKCKTKSTEIKNEYRNSCENENIASFDMNVSYLNDKINKKSIIKLPSDGRYYVIRNLELNYSHPKDNLILAHADEIILRKNGLAFIEPGKEVWIRDTENWSEIPLDVLESEIKETIENYISTLSKTN